ncbi:uncharacterized protein TRIVIDRAFT_41674 [Trichoderma virens Gv29-8]|uniref:Cerato-platanin n=1 Tax=Hypocrea virens (strain Gv29-8 / FGSC 10586) TaxID=413071 RepID=G9N802_HYPVG|nr:uncharacterized protein TRIVIDRAFT_41674 [Trichoderma virens Gv29-8]EHK17114.1 hypothetical protein TRIVIDRAFT_41674 [Trichoderma virens Gv29-8]UKZ55530.1 hypothetical protein TrVGV298_009354 [Trichoderma virens]UKZ81299.1 hypothetical protein TrVFT333_009071 [Trichoderma virens FT-333]
MPSFLSIVGLAAAAASSVSAGVLPRANTASVTPHEQYSSSVGVLGCLINTNRVAYWPSSVDCNNICVELTYQGRSLTVLKIDQSGGAYDISYDAWNQLIFGQPATVQPQQGGGVSVQWQYVDNSRCSDLLHNGKLPLSAANSMNYVASCLNQPNSWVAKNYELINLLDPVCHWGWNEVCNLNLKVSNQASCPHQLGDPHPSGLTVNNIQYGTGKIVAAL